MNMIVVDDEPPALKDMEWIIRKVIPDGSLYCFQNPDQAIQFAKETHIDVAFLDIELGIMNGLSLAKELKEIDRKINIVFVTGYSEYALDAFSVSASGYLLKPVTAEMITEAMEDLRNPVVPQNTSRIRVQTFGNFEVFVENQPVSFGRSKAKETFAYLIDRRGASVTKKELAATFWEDEPYNHNKQAQLQVFISEMLKSLKAAGVDDVIIKRYNSISVDVTKIDCDYFRFVRGDLTAVNAYMGEYMKDYSWAEFTLAGLNMQKNNMA